MGKEIENIKPNELYNQYSEDILRYTYSILRNYEEARDIVQEVFIHHFENENAFQGKCSYKTWLFIIARNLCISRLRNKGFNNKRLEEYSFEKSYTNSYDIKITLMEAINKLSKESSELLYLKEYEGYSYAEISEITNLTVENVAVKLFRAKKILRKYLKDFREE